MKAIELVVLDMGGVILEMGPSGGLPFGELETRGRSALVAAAGATHAEVETLVFEPWSHGYRQRRERGREESFWPHLERLASRSTVDAETLLRAYFEPYSRWLQPLPSALETVSAVAAAGYRLAIVSNVPMPGAGYRWALSRLGIEQFFADLRFSHDEGSRKPAPVMLGRVLDRLGVDSSRAVMVGDRRREDVGSGLALGCATVWLESRYHDGPAADATIADLAALPALLATWRGNGPQS